MPDEREALVEQLTDLWKRRHELTAEEWLEVGPAEEWLEVGPVALGYAIAALAERQPEGDRFAKGMLLDLLAVIHRDGGHKVAEVGIAGASQQAMLLSSERIAERQPAPEVWGLVVELQAKAVQTSKFMRGVAEAKSLRQTDNPEQRFDLYEWLAPEQTVEGRAAAMLTTLSAENFALAAGQCIVKGGLVGDDHGHPYCTLSAQLAERDALIAETLGKLRIAQSLSDGEAAFWQRAADELDESRAALSSKGEG